MKQKNGFNTRSSLCEVFSFASRKTSPSEMSVLSCLSQNNLSHG